MTALVAADVVVTVNPRNALVSGKKRRVQCSIAFGDSALTYPSGGIPLPNYGKFGMHRNLDYIAVVSDSAGLGYKFVYDKTNHKLIMQHDNENATYLTKQVFAPIATSVAPAPIVLQVEAVGW